MRALRSIIMSFSMFSRLPTPRVEWQSQNMSYAVAALPLVGALSGLALWGFSALCGALSLGAPLRAAGYALIPLLISGGIHLDGLADTADALASHAPAEKKREILKDPHSGAFAVAAVGGWLVSQFALGLELADFGRAAMLLGLSQVLSRALGALATLLYPSRRGGGLLDAFRDSAGRGAAAIAALFALLAAAGLTALAPVPGLAAVLAAAGVMLYLYFMSKKQFGGMSGDLAGWLIESCNLAAPLGFILAQRAVEAWF